ncbi:MAG: hypothetical protein Q8K60_02675 [Parachlamydiaceae bacterium]|nr:hypothetical protein [Parachlamydiaceae bacterium]
MIQESTNIHNHQFRMSSLQIENDSFKLDKHISNCISLFSLLNPIYKYEIDRYFLISINRELNAIEALFNEALFNNQLENFKEECQQLRQLYQLLSDKLIPHSDFTIDMLKNEELKNWMHRFKWLLLILDNSQYVNIKISKQEPFHLMHYKYHLSLCEKTLELPWNNFCQIINPLIINFYTNIDLLNIEVSANSIFYDPNDHTPRTQKNIYLYSSKEILFFLEQKNALPRELITEVPWSRSYSLKPETQATLRVAFNYGVNSSFPKQIESPFIRKYDLWFKAKKITTTFKQGYKKYFLDDLYFSLKLFCKHYQGNAKSLIEYQNAIKVLKINKPGIKTINFSFHFKRINELLTVYKKADQQFKLGTNEDSPIYPRKLFKLLLNPEKSNFLPIILKAQNSSISIYSDIFFGIFFHSIQSPKEITFNEVSIRYFNNKITYSLNYSPEVCNNAINFWRNRPMKQMISDDIYDLFFLFARAKVSCKDLAIDEEYLRSNIKTWKNLFIKWNVAFNPV